MNYSLPIPNNVFWVIDPFRTNFLSHIPGGCGIIIEYQDKKLHGYSKVKHPDKYVEKIVAFDLGLSTDELLGMQLSSLVKKVKKIYRTIYVMPYREEEIQINKDVQKMERMLLVWQSDTDENQLPWECINERYNIKYRGSDVLVSGILSTKSLSLICPDEFAMPQLEIERHKGIIVYSYVDILIKFLISHYEITTSYYLVNVLLQYINRYNATDDKNILFEEIFHEIEDINTFRKDFSRYTYKSNQFSCYDTEKSTYYSNIDLLRTFEQVIHIHQDKSRKSELLYDEYCDVYKIGGKTLFYLDADFWNY